MNFIQEQLNDSPIQSLARRTLISERVKVPIRKNDVKNKIWIPEQRIGYSISKLEMETSYHNCMEILNERFNDFEDSLFRNVLDQIKEITIFDNKAENLYEGFLKLEEKNVMPAKLIMNSKTYTNFLSENKEQFQSSEAVFGIEIIRSEHCKDNEIFAISEPEFVGKIPIRQDLTVEENEDNVLFYKNLEMLVDPNAIVRMKVDTRGSNFKDERKRKQFLHNIDKFKKYRFISK